MNSRDENSGRPSFTVGNAPTDAVAGWFVGQFVSPSGGLRRTDHLEVKWGVHPAGDLRSGWSETSAGTTLSILIDGRFIVRLRADGGTHEVRLDARGDYVLFGAGVPHSWEAPVAALVLTIRFPSVQGDAIPSEPARAHS